MARVRLHVSPPPPPLRPAPRPPPFPADFEAKEELRIQFCENPATKQLRSGVTGKSVFTFPYNLRMRRIMIRCVLLLCAAAGVRAPRTARFGWRN